MFFYVQLLKVGSCTTDDNFFCFFKWFYFRNLLLLGQPQDFDENCYFLSLPRQCTGIPVKKITLSQARKCMISDVDIFCSYELS